VGRHPEDGEMILANFGRFGPYVQHGKTYANLKDPRDVFTIGLNHAVALIADKKARGSARAGAAALKSLGDHPDGGAIEVFEGRYGPYVKWGKVNATLPKDVTPDAVTLEQAIELVNAKGGSAKKKAPAKKAAAKKPAAKKAAPKKKAPAKKDEE
jgi:DNA topoisomerase-1